LAAQTLERIANTALPLPMTPPSEPYTSNHMPCVRRRRIVGPMGRLGGEGKKQLLEKAREAERTRN
jgi:hypothetical protein